MEDTSLYVFEKGVSYGNLINLELCSNLMYFLRIHGWKITRRCISLCDKYVLNDMVMLETITKGNKKKRFKKCT